MKQKKAKKERLTVQEQTEDFRRQLKSGTRFTYPNSQGISGQVFKSREVFYVNDMQESKKFIPSIDNLSTV